MRQIHVPEELYLSLEKRAAEKGVNIFAIIEEDGKQAHNFGEFQHHEARVLTVLTARFDELKDAIERNGDMFHLQYLAFCSCFEIFYKTREFLIAKVRAGQKL